VLRDKHRQAWARQDGEREVAGKDCDGKQDSARVGWASGHQLPGRDLATNWRHLGI
jgi:hypothetical protein